MPQSFSQQISKLPPGLRTRFAPSPTGYLHLGHVASAIYVWGIARLAKAEIILRIEDHDQGRCRKTYEDEILRDLAWLGFEPDDGVSSAAPSAFRQSNHWDRYEKALSAIAPWTFRCRCSRREILERSSLESVSSELLYDGYCRTRDEGPNIRFRMPEDTISFEDGIAGLTTQRPIDQCGDLLLKDRDGFWTYNFAVAVDDKEEGINLIIRGQDILPSTARQFLLGDALGGTRPKTFHHPLIWADPLHKLSKRDRSTSIGEWRAGGLNAEDILGKAAFQVGLLSVESPLSVRDLGELFS